MAVSQETLRELETEAYLSVMRALYAGQYDLEKEELLTKLRGHLHIDHPAHAEALAAVKEDLQALREGRDVIRPRGRFGRTAPLASEGLLAAPSASTKRLGSRGFGATVGSRGRVAVGQSRRGARGGIRNNSVDPYGYLGRRIWRRWPEEDPEWIEGFVYEYDAESGTHSILYDPNVPERETVEDGYSFAAAAESDYVLGDFTDLKLAQGSRRVAERPFENPSPPPANAAAVTAALAATPTLRSAVPNKKRKTSGVGTIPATAPFDQTWFRSRIDVAGEEELGGMLQVLDRKELEMETELRLLEQDVEINGDAEARAELDRMFAQLCEREAAIMKELAAVRAAEE